MCAPLYGYYVTYGWEMIKEKKKEYLQWWWDGMKYEMEQGSYMNSLNIICIHKLPNSIRWVASAIQTYIWYTNRQWHSIIHLYIYYTCLFFFSSWYIFKKS